MRYSKWISQENQLMTDLRSMSNALLSAMSVTAIVVFLLPTAPPPPPARTCDRADGPPFPLPPPPAKDAPTAPSFLALLMCCELRRSSKVVIFSSGTGDRAAHAKWFWLNSVHSNHWIWKTSQMRNLVGESFEAFVLFCVETKPGLEIGPRFGK